MRSAEYIISVCVFCSSLDYGSSENNAIAYYTSFSTRNIFRAPMYTRYFTYLIRTVHGAEIWMIFYARVHLRATPERNEKKKNNNKIKNKKKQTRRICRALAICNITIHIPSCEPSCATLDNTVASG